MTNNNKPETLLPELEAALDRAYYEKENGDYELIWNAARAHLAAQQQSAGRWQDADEWHDDDGDALWCRVPVCEPPYVGSPLCETWIENYYTHFWTFSNSFWPTPPSKDEQ